MIQTFVSCFYYLFFRQSLLENKFNKTFWTNLSYVVLPLLPVAYTIFWQITSLHGTVVLLKMKKCLDRLVHTSSSDKNDLCSNEKKYHLLLRKKSATGKKLVLTRKPTNRNSTLKINKVNENTSTNHRLNNNLSRKSHVADNEILELSNIDNDEYESDESEHMLVNNFRRIISEDDISCINDLSSIDSLFDSLPFDENTNSKANDNIFTRHFRELQFYIKIVRAIVFNDNKKIIFDEDCRNAKFIYFSNFLVGLGIITVNKTIINI